jgi:hypothetical protein
MPQVKLLRPLDGKKIGDIAEYNFEDTAYLLSLGVVEEVSEKADQPVAKKSKGSAPENKAA